MRTLRSWLSRFSDLFNRRGRDRELADELESHLRLHIDDNLRAGIAPEEARRRALIALDGIEQVKESYRERRGLRWLETCARDARFGLRMLRNNLGFTTIAVLSLALGIGANTAIFTLIDAVMLRMLPVKNPQELVSLNLAPDTQFPRDANGDLSTQFPYPAFVQMREHNQVLSALFAFKDAGRVSVLVNGNAEIVQGQLVTSNYFSALGVRTVLGRDFVSRDDAAGAESVAIISYGYWQSHFGGQTSALGRQILANGAPVTVIGVAAPGFFGLQPGSAVDLYMPMAMQPQIVPNVADPANRGTSAFAQTDLWWIQLMGRLKPGVTAEQARANLDVIYRPAVLQGLQPEAAKGPLVPPALEVVPAGGGLNGLRGTFSKPLAILMVVVGIVLLIACVNVANLLLVRSSARAKEIAVRLALGASRGRLIRQLLLESVLLSAFGGLLGLVFAYWGCNALVAMIPDGDNLVLIDVHPDLNVLGFTVAACVLTGVLFGLTPALRATRVELTPALKQTTATLGTTRDTMYTTKTLVVAQVALSVVLLFGAGLFVRTLVNLETMNVGFSRDNLLLFGVSPKDAGYKGQRYADLCREIQSRVGQLPGVESATSSLIMLVSGSMWLGNIQVPGYSARPNENTSVSVLPVGEGFLSTMRIPLLEGRDLSPRDDESALKVALVNETLARKYWRNENPLGRHFTLRNVDMEVVGIVGDAKYTSLRQNIPPTVYYPYVQQMDNMPGMRFEVRTAGDATALIPSVRQIVASIDNRLPLFDVKTQTQQVDEILYQERLFAKLVGFFATLALVLVCVGLYGVMSYSVARRTSEIGIRMALGAQPGNILGMVLRETMLLVGAGVVLGVGASLGTAKIASHHVAGLLYGLKITDTASIWVAVAFIAIVAAVSGFVPARRAMRVDPMVALRHE